MQKKIFGILICTLLLTTVLSAAKFNPYTDDNLGYKEINYYRGFVCNKVNILDQLMHDISEPDIQGKPSPRPEILDTPDYFNWMDYNGNDWTTYSKAQQWCGSCWVFAALGALESIIEIEEECSYLNIDLSEQYVMSCLPTAGDCLGGYAYSTYYYIKKTTPQGNNCNGIIPESCFSYRAIDVNGCDFNDCDNDPVLCSEKCENWDNYLIPIVEHGYFRPEGSFEDIEAIKTQIMENGPVTSFMMVTTSKSGEDNFKDWGWEHNNPNDYYPCVDDYEYVNHIVVIVGWKDDPSIANGGYWICKNSWGDDFGYDGFFNIEYNSSNINNYQVDWVNYDPGSYNNWIPVADAGGTYFGNFGEEIIFDGSGSFDHEGDISTWEWDFGDETFGHDEISSKIYDTEDVYSVNLTVIDDEGNMNFQKTWAFIGRTNKPPEKPLIKGYKEIKNNTKYEYTFSAVDPDGDDVYYLIIWGGSQANEYWIGPYSSGEEVTLKNSWVGYENYTIRVKAKDIYDLKSDWSTMKVNVPRYKKSDSTFPIYNRMINHYSNILPLFKLLTNLLVK
jgi:hypothetical protein